METKFVSRIKGLNVILLILMMTLSCTLFDFCSGVDCEFKGKISANDLISVIKYYQDKHVRKSYGEYDGECFTDVNYKTFREDKITEQITNELRKSNLLKELVKEIGKLNEAEREKLLNRGLSTYQPTWSELGRISVEGQTIAGQRAQKDIAQTIVDLVKNELGIL